MVEEPFGCQPRRAGGDQNRRDHQRRWQGSHCQLLETSWPIALSSGSSQAESFIADLPQERLAPMEWRGFRTPASSGANHPPAGIPTFCV